MRETKYIVDYIVQYTDPTHQVDGAVKTRIFSNVEEAFRLVETLLMTRPEITDTTVTRQTNTIVRERI
jgi:hypothetical protein